MSSQTAATIALILFFALVVISAYVSIRLQLRAARQHSHKQEKEKQVAFMLHPAYQAKIQAERNYTLALAKLDITRQKLDLKRYATLHRVPAETYLINEEVNTLTPLPSLRPITPDKLITSAEPPALAAIPTFTQLLQQGTISESNPFIIGIRQNGELRTGSWLDLYTLAVAGIAGTGKSTSVLFYLLQAVLHHARLIMIDPHAETKPDSLAKRLRGLSASCFQGKFAITNHDILARVRWTANELQRRQKSGKDQPLILVVDEFTRLMRTKEIAEELGELLEAIAQEGRGYNIFALLTGQIWTATRTGGTELRYSLASSLIHRIQEAQAELLIPRKYARYCPELKTGQALLYDTNGQSEILSMPLTTILDVSAVTHILTSSSFPPSFQPPSRNGSSPIMEAENRTMEGQILPLEVPTEPLTEVHPFNTGELEIVASLLAEEKSPHEIVSQVWSLTGGREYQEKKQLIQKMTAHLIRQTR